MALKTRRANTSDIYYMALELAREEQCSGLKCPFCEGGETGERSLSVKREEFYAQYKCHRASCGKSGRVPMIGSAPVTTKIRSEVGRYNNIISKLSTVPTDIISILTDKYHFNKVDLGRLDAKWSEELNRLAIPIFSMSSVNTGVTLRSFDEKAVPKTLNYITNFTRPPTAWYRNYNTGSKKIIVVEDQLSAARASSFVTAIALCGCSINIFGIKEIANHDPDHVVFCLDADAFSEGLILQKKWGGMFKNCTVAKPPKDLKNMNPDELREFMTELFGE